VQDKDKARQGKGKVYEIRQAMSARQRLDKARQGKARQDKTRQDKTRQGKARQDNTNI
jgi:hypothetical protein